MNKLFHPFSLCIVFIIITVASSTLAADPEGGLTFGAEGGDDVFQSYFDLFLPCVSSESSVFFLNPRGLATDGSAQEFNLGLGYRHLLPGKDVIIGANLYYDSRWTEHNNHFNQAGAGLELLTKHIDARVNYYIPEKKEEMADSVAEQTVESTTTTTWGDMYASGNSILQDYTTTTRSTITTHFLERFEQGREGLDMEVGVKIPGLDKLGEVRVFAGYYWWDSQYTENDRIEGMKGRLEIRALPALYLDAQVFEDDELFGSEWLLGARLRLPFDMVNLANGKNPFANSGAGFKRQNSPFSQRLNEMVIRDLAIHTEKSQYKENKNKLITETETGTKTIANTALANVTFVDGDNTGDPGKDGTAEHPYDTIQKGVDNANSPVYVYDSTVPYNECVTITKNVDLIGSGYLLQGNSGKTFGSGIHPTVIGDTSVAGAFLIPLASTAENVSIRGFEIQHPGNNGVLAYSIPTFTCSHNIVHNVSRGIAFHYANGASGTAYVTDNTIYDTTSDATRSNIDNSSTPGTVIIHFTNNSINNSGGRGYLLEVRHGSQLGLYFNNNLVNDTLRDPLLIAAYNDSQVRTEIENNNLAGRNNEAGLHVGMYGTSSISLRVNYNTCVSNHVVNYSHTPGIPAPSIEAPTGNNTGITFVQGPNPAPIYVPAGSIDVSFSTP